MIDLKALNWQPLTCEAAEKHNLIAYTNGIEIQVWEQADGTAALMIVTDNGTYFSDTPAHHEAIEQMLGTNWQRALTYRLGLYLADLWEDAITATAKENNKPYSIARGNLFNRYMRRWYATPDYADPCPQAKDNDMVLGTCTRCGGSGRTGFVHIMNGVCFGCDGTGKQYMTAKAARAAAWEDSYKEPLNKQLEWAKRSAVETLDARIKTMAGRTHSMSVRELEATI